MDETASSPPPSRTQAILDVVSALMIGILASIFIASFLTVVISTATQAAIPPFGRLFWVGAIISGLAFLGSIMFARTKYRRELSKSPAKAESGRMMSQGTWRRIDGELVNEARIRTSNRKDDQ